MPKKKIGKHLQFYMDCMKNDCTMPSQGVSVIKGGLCRAADIGHISENIFKIFSDGMNSYHYWADDGNNYDPYENGHNFNTLRQTIVLFMAAIAGEL